MCGLIVNIFVLNACALPAQLLAGLEKLSMHTACRELSEYVTAVTANQSGYMIRMPASQHLEVLKGQRGGVGRG